MLVTLVFGSHGEAEDHLFVRLDGNLEGGFHIGVLGMAEIAFGDPVVTAQLVQHIDCFRLGGVVAQGHLDGAFASAGAQVLMVPHQGGGHQVEGGAGVDLHLFVLAGVRDAVLADEFQVAVAVLLINLNGCLLYTSDAADDLLCVDLGGRRILKKTNEHETNLVKDHGEH